MIQVHGCAKHKCFSVNYNPLLPWKDLSMMNLLKTKIVAKLSINKITLKDW